MQSSELPQQPTACRLPAGLIGRPITEDDAARVLEVLDAVERAEPSDEHWGIDDVLEEMRSPGTDLGRRSYGVFDEGRLVGFGVLMLSAPDTAFRTYLFGGVDPAHGHRGIGTAIVEELADRAVLLRDEHDPALPGEFKLWIPSARDGTAALARARAFETWRWFFRMQRDLGHPIAPAEPATGFVIRPYRPDDEEPIRLARNASFADHWGSAATDPERWHAAFEGSQTFRPLHSRVAMAQDGSPAAFVMVQEFASDTAARGYATGHIAVVGTVRAARGRGLATALVNAAMQSLAGDGYRYAELVVDADSPTGAGRIYERVGFVTLERDTVVGRRF